MRKRILSLLLTLVLFGALTLNVSAHEVPDYNRRGSIAVSMTYQGKPISGGTLTIYRAADVAADNGDYFFEYTEDFVECAIPVTELNSAELPEKLAEIAKTKKLQGTTKNVDGNGKVRFSDLEIGLYLVVQKDAAPGYTTIKPFLVSVPQNEDGHYVYDVDTAPKNIPEPEVKPTEPEPTKPPKPDDKLPQTGQTNWPVPVMAASGMILLVAGFCLRTSGKRKQDEA